MQLFNKEFAKKAFTHTWYIYPLAVSVISLGLVLGFQAFHQPSAHQKLSIFFATNITNDRFTKKILDQYEKEDLREVAANFIDPNNSLYYTKLKVYLSNSDLLVLPKTTMNEFKDYYANYFVEINDSIKSKYINGEQEYFSIDGHDYGIKINKNDESYWLNQYMSFINEDYYIALSIGSKNLGNVIEESNEHYDNGLTVINYLLEGI